MRPALAALLLAGCGGAPAWCDVAALVDAEAAPNATDCGTAPLDDDDAVIACLVAAFRAGEPFRGLTQQSVPGGGLLVRAWVGDDRGVRVLLGDFTLCDDDACAGTVVRRACGEPAVQTVVGREQLVCGDASACGDVLCGEPGTDCP